MNTMSNNVFETLHRLVNSRTIYILKNNKPHKSLLFLDSPGLRNRSQLVFNSDLTNFS